MKLYAAILLALLLHGPVQAQGRFSDPEDGAFDLSEFLLDQKGFLPVPLLVTEPAVGTGAGVVVTFFRESIRDRTNAAKEGGRLTPPDIFAVGGIGTENGTRAAFAGGMMGTEDGRYRWRGGVGRMDVNLDFYGLGGRESALAYNLNGLVSIQQGLMRLADSDVWLGARWTFLDLDNRFGIAGASRLDSLVKSSRASGLGVGLELDTRDNMFTPSRGMKGAVDLNFYHPNWGSDTEFQAYRAHLFGYLPLGKTLVLGGRADARAVSGGAPFYMMPFIELRGVPLMRLQDERTALVETEVRWNFMPRWSLVGFLGAGRVWGSQGTSFSQGTETATRGAGFRYEIARRLGMHVGMDWARSTQGDAFYIQIGGAWR